MRFVLLLLIVGCSAPDRFVVTELHTVDDSPFVAQEILADSDRCGNPACKCVRCRCLADAVNQKTGSKPKPIEVTLWTYPGCGPCESLKANIGNGDGDFIVKPVVETGPYTFSHYPVLTAPGREPLRGSQTKTAVRKWLGLPEVAPDGGP